MKTESEIRKQLEAVEKRIALAKSMKLEGTMFMIPHVAERNTLLWVLNNRG